MSQKREISQELQDTVRSNPKIDKVYFGENGRHYFFVQKNLFREEGDNNEYGEGEFSHKQVIPGATNVDGLREDISKGIKSSRIVETMTRQEILDANPKQSGQDLVSQVKNLSPDDINILKAILGGMTPNQSSEADSAPTSSEADSASASASTPRGKK